MTDFQDPDTIDVYEVIANVTHAFKLRGHTWNEKMVWPNVTVMALANEVLRLQAALDAEKLSVAPGDVVVVTSPQSMHYDPVFAELLKAQFPDNLILMKRPDVDITAKDEVALRAVGWVRARVQP